MKQFFKFVFASIFGVFIAVILLFIFVSVIIFGALKSNNENVEITDNSILHLNLNYPIMERSDSNPLNELNIGPLSSQKTIGLNTILAGIKHAKDDDKIKGIYLDATYLSTGMATVEEIRNSLLNFKKSGKFVLAYSEVYTQSAYYLATAANKIYLNPQGILELKGFSNQNMFFKGALDKLDIEAQIIKVGTYKSAVEPFILDKMSDANKQQTESLLNSLYQHFIANIANSRNLSSGNVKNMADSLLSRSPNDALKLKLVDGLKYKDKVIEELKSLTSINLKDDLNIVNLDEYTKSIDSSNEASNKIAVIYANGEIMSGEGDENTIGSESISRYLRKARLDDDVKSVVLRVNSPGGSSLASDVIWREVSLIKQVKPIVVSMGDYAASGGYYIACAANTIVAEPNTITGSIGVFAIIPNMKGFFNNKLGITFDGVKTGNYADLGDVNRPLTDSEKLIFQKEVNRTYDEFISRVANGRKLNKNTVDSIGQGRVWTGEQALKLKLVDKLGHIDDAVSIAAKKANISEFKLVSYPEQKSGLLSFIENSEENIKEKILKSELGANYTYYKKVKQVSQTKGIFARLPLSFNLNGY